jgi:hypothetical protein
VRQQQLCTDYKHINRTSTGDVQDCLRRIHHFCRNMTRRYGGLNDPSQGQCAANYPAGASRHICGHVSFVELDGQMSYKQALAFWATGDVRHARTALRIMSGWAAVNKVFGPAMDGNGPLEAAWVSD